MSEPVVIGPLLLPPNPGSDEAQARGCLCPRMDNAYGRGHCGVAGLFVWRMDCPLHTRNPSTTSTVAT